MARREVSISIQLMLDYAREAEEMVEGRSWHQFTGMRLSFVTTLHLASDGAHSSRSTAPKIPDRRTASERSANR